MARRTAGTEASPSPSRTDGSPLHATDRDGVLSFGADADEFADDTIISVTDEVIDLLGSVSLGSHDAGLAASLGWNFFTFG